MRQSRRLFQLPWRSARRIRDEFEEELAFHYDMRVDELVNAGVPIEQARERSAREFGDVDDARRYVRRVDHSAETATQRTDMMRSGIHEFLGALRRLRRSLAFSTTAVLTLALGIGACVLMFNIVSAVLLAPLPFKNPERIAIIWGYYPQLGPGMSRQPIHGRRFVFMRDNASSVNAIAAFRSRALNLGVSATPERLDAVESTGEFFDVFGVRPSIGTFFARRNELAGSDHVVVLSYDLWQRRFGGDASAVGRVVTLSGEPYTVIGVAPPSFTFPRGAEMPASFQFPARVDVWVPLVPPTRGPSDLVLVAKLSAGVSIEAARHDMDRIRDLQEKLIPQAKGSFATEIVPLREQLVGSVRPMLVSLLAAVVLLLAIACVNTIQLQLAQLHARRRELAIRRALGASDARLVVGLASELLILTGIADMVGGFGAWAGLRLLARYASSKLPRLAEAHLDARTILVAAAATLAAGLFTGLVAALLGNRVPLVETLRRGERGSGGATSSQRLRRILIGAELTLSVVLVASACLLSRSLSRQLRTATGFAAPNGLTFEVTLPSLRYPEKQGPTYMEHPAAAAFFTAALETIRAIPGVQAAGIGKPLPLSGAQEASGFYAEGAPIPTSQADSPIAEFTIASPDMFRSLGTPIVDGRDFSASDREETLPVMIVNQAMARRYWPGQSAVGKRIRLGGPRSPAEWMTIVGVAADIKRYSLVETPRPEMIVPYTQNPYPTFASMQFVVRSPLPPEALAPALAKAIAAVDASIPISRLRTIEDLVAETSADARFASRFMTGFGASALILAMIGLYGVIAFGVHQRRQEFGIRRALGASPREIVQLVMREGIRLTAISLAVGAGLAVLAGRALSRFLYEISPFDGITLAATVTLLALATLAACFAPAWKASQVEARVALEE